MMWLDLFIVLIEGVIVAVSCYLMYRPRSRPPKSLPRAAPGPPFDAAAYLARMEDAYLSMLAAAQPVDQTITLWLGLDGLRIDPDGTSAWICRDLPPSPSSFAQPWESGRLYAPPLPPGVEILYADNAIAACCCGSVQTIMQTMEQSMDQLRTENEIKRLEAQLDQVLKKQEW